MQYLHPPIKRNEIGRRQQATRSKAHRSVHCHHVRIAPALTVLTYYPGFVFSDSLSSIGQALGQLPCSNHFPVAYTALIGACIALAHTLGLSTTTGCALYSLMQTFVMCATYSLMIQWIMQRTRIARWWRAILVAVLALPLT